MEKFLHVKSCDSTQELIKEQLSLNPSDDFIISCDHQFNGHGRGQNKWLDSAGTLCFSLSLPGFKIPSFTAMELAVIICSYFESKNKKILLKWPNDLINQSGKKCGGILLQSFQHQYLAGIGLNLFHDEINFGGIYEKPFDLKKEIWSKEIAQYIKTHRYSDTEKLTFDWIALCSHLNQIVQVHENDTVIEGKFIGLGQHGEALVETIDGIKSLFNGSLRLI